MRAKPSVIHAVWIVALLASCASALRPIAVNGSVAGFAAPGPYRVVEFDLDWFDAKRNRHVLVHMYAPESSTAPVPIVIFSHGLGNSRTDYRYLGQMWASHGFLSVHPEHLGASVQVTRHGPWRLFRAGFDRRNWRNLPDDIHFVIDQLQSDAALPALLRGRLDRGRIAVAGHSLGAYAALAMGGLRVLFPDGTIKEFRDPRVRAAIAISMSENFNASSYAAIAIPVLHITGTRDSSVFYGTLPKSRRVPFNSIARDDQYLVAIRGANHSTFSDEESTENRVAHDVVRLTTVAFLDAYLRDDARALEVLRGAALSDSIREAARLSTKSTPLRVGRISIRTLPLFTAGEASRGGFYRVANVAAVPTPESIIRKFLLFREGDEFDKATLQESERNLRALHFLKSASITAGTPHDGVVDIAVATQDAWTTDLNLDFSNDGGRSLYDVNVTQKDLFGTGAEVGVTVASGRERSTRSIEILHPSMFGHYWSADLLYANNSDGNEEKLAIARPLFSYATRYTWDGSFDHLLRDERIYRDGVVAKLSQQQHASLTLLSGRTIGSRPDLTTRVMVGVDVQRDRFEPILGDAPADRDFRFLEAGLDATSLRFITLNHVDFGMRDQDFSLGSHAELLAGRSRGGIWRFRSDESYGYAFTPRNLLLAHLGATTRAGAVNRNALLSADCRWIAQLKSEHPQAFVARLRVDVGRDIDRDSQFFADGQNGLRAYPNFAFEGTRRFIFNAEHRWFLGRELLEIFEPGAAVFVDSGTATDRSLIRGALRSDFGAGLRVGIARFESAMLRLDVAYAANSSPLSRRGFVVSFGTAQAF